MPGERKSIVIEKPGSPTRVFHVEQGVPVDVTVNKVKSQLPGWGSGDSSASQPSSQEKSIPAKRGALEDRKIWEKLLDFREILGLEPDAIVDSNGKRLRELIGL